MEAALLAAGIEQLNFEELEVDPAANKMFGPQEAEKRMKLLSQYTVETVTETVDDDTLVSQVKRMQTRMNRLERQIQKLNKRLAK